MKLHKPPVLQKRYKVIWEYYYSFGRKTTKTFEHVDHETALEWVRTLIDRPITNSVRVTDYEGSWKSFEPSGESAVTRRVSFLEDARQALGEDYAKILKRMGSPQDTPLQVRANLDFIRDKRDLEKYVNLIALGEFCDDSLFDVAGIPVSKVVRRCGALERGCPDEFPPVPKLTDYQKRLLRSVKMWHPDVDRDVARQEVLSCATETI